MQSLRQQDGSSLSMDEQLCGGGEFEAFYALFNIYVDLCGVFLGAVWVELLLLCR